MRYLKLYFLFLFVFASAGVTSQAQESVNSEKEYFIEAHKMAANDFNDSLLREYIKQYPKGEYSDKALSSMDICAWQNARFKNTKEAYQQYLDSFPKGKAKKLAQQNLKLLVDSTSNK